MSATKEYYHEAIVAGQRPKAFLIVYCRNTKIANVLQASVCNVLKSFDRRVVSISNVDVFLENIIDAIKQFSEKSKLKTLLLDCNQNGEQDIILSYGSLASLSFLGIKDLEPIEND